MGTGVHRTARARSSASQIAISNGAVGGGPPVGTLPLVRTSQRVLSCAVLLLAAAGCSSNEAPAPDPSGGGEPVSSPAPTATPPLAQPFAVPVPEPDEVAVTQRRYAAGAGTAPTRLDLYRPVTGDPRRLVVMVPGPSAGPEAPPLVAWARLLAGSGLAVALPEYDGTEDVAAGGTGGLGAATRVAMAHFGIRRVAVLGFSAGGPYAVRLARDVGDRLALLYARVEPTPPANPPEPRAYSLTALVSEPGSPEVFLAYGATDAASGIAAANRRALGDEALRRTAQVLRHPGGHAFELTDDDPRAAAILKKCIDFLLG